MEEIDSEADDTGEIGDDDLNEIKCPDVTI